MGIWKKCEQKRLRHWRRRNRFQPEHEPLDGRVLLSAIADAGFGTSAGHDIALHPSAASDVASDHAKPTATVASSTTKANSSRVTPPVAPSFTATAVSPTQINLAWSHVSAATGYLVDEWENGAWWQIDDAGSSSSGFAVTGLSPDTTYYFDVGAFNKAGTNWANYQAATTLAQTVKPPGVPSLSATAVSPAQINLSWTGESGANGYLIDQWENSAWIEIGSVGSGTTNYSVTGLNASTTYYFTVGAYNAAGTSWASYQSATTPAQTVAPPPAPSFTATAESATEINLAWTNVSSATGYMVNELENGTWVELAAVGTGGTSYLVTGLSANTTYTFDVGAHNAGGTTWASPQSATTPQATITQTNTVWSGYAITPSNLMNAVGATWVQPAISSTGANSIVSIWVGIDGFGNNTVEQIGTSWSASSGYYAWVEFYGDGVRNAQGGYAETGKYFYETPLNSIIGSNFFNIEPGDTISAYVGFVSSTSTNATFAFRFQSTPPGGTTQAWQEDLTTQFVVPVRTTAEWIVESPDSGVYPLANFGTMTFSGAWASAGATAPITAFPNYQLDMVPGTGGGTDFTSTLASSLNARPVGVYR